MAHHTEVRIDLIWVLSVDRLVLTSFQILARRISDHAPVLMSWGTPTQTVCLMMRFSAWYLKNPESVDFIDQELGNYFRENSRSVALCADSKPSLRGVIKGYFRQREAQQSQLTTELEGGIVDLEHRVQRSDGGQLGRLLALLSAELRQVSLAEARQCWQASTQRVYKLGDKTVKLLYWVAAHDVSAMVVPLIRDQTGSIQEELQAITHTLPPIINISMHRSPSPQKNWRTPCCGDIPQPLWPKT
ncbi:hypothetical protein NDU88_001835 [Pleurodeles waltl]|uniref:Uncharacterized protein n=1 Tax=Pleurodeles waltl TaxID=8319 RepID=A0AAV7UTU7_PLEWA|nr:hypothetical protein NDU88_001835 [Pleurodeles waltl]